MNSLSLPLKVAVAGDFLFREFAAMFEHTGTAVRQVPSHSPNAISDNEPIDLLVLCQANRHSDAKQLAEPLADRFPNSARVLLLGSDCEGELRSGQPVAGWYRRFWYQWKGLLAGLTIASQTQISHPAVEPATARDSDRLLQMATRGDFRRAMQTGKASISIAIDCRWNSEFDFFVDGFSPFGLVPARIPDVDRTFDSIILVRDSLDEETAAAIGATRESHLAANLVLIINFPRLDEWRTAMQLGVDQVLGRPLLLEELAYSLARPHHPAPRLVT